MKLIEWDNVGTGRWMCNGGTISVDDDGMFAWAVGSNSGGCSSLAAAKAAAEACLTPERDPLDVEAAALGCKWWARDILHDRNGREVATVCDGEGFIRIYPNDVTDFAKNKRATLRAVRVLRGQDSAPLYAVERREYPYGGNVPLVYTETGTAAELGIEPPPEVR